MKKEIKFFSVYQENENRYTKFFIKILDNCFIKPRFTGGLSYD